VPDYDHLDVFNAVACLCDCGVEIHACVVVDAGEDVLDWGADEGGIVVAAAGLVEDQAFGWVSD